MTYLCPTCTHAAEVYNWENAAVDRRCNMRSVERDRKSDIGKIVRQVSAVAVLGLGAHIGARFTYKSTGAILERL